MGNTIDNQEERAFTPEAGVAREDARAHRANAATARAELDTRA